MRVFVACFPDPRSAERLDGVRRALSDAPRLRTVPAANRHVTVKFLGERDPDVVERARCAVAELSRAAIACHAVGYLALPSRRRARVLAVLIDSAGVLEALATEVEAALAWLAAPAERDFVAHLTLARSPRPLRLGALPTLEEPVPVTLEPPALYVSELSREGARYRRLDPTVRPSTS